MDGRSVEIAAVPLGNTLSAVGRRSWRRSSRPKRHRDEMSAQKNGEKLTLTKPSVDLRSNNWVARKWSVLSNTGDLVMAMAK